MSSSSRVLNVHLPGQMVQTLWMTVINTKVSCSMTMLWTIFGLVHIERSLANADNRSPIASCNNIYKHVQKLEFIAETAISPTISKPKTMIAPSIWKINVTDSKRLMSWRSTMRQTSWWSAPTLIPCIHREVGLLGNRTLVSSSATTVSSQIWVNTKYTGDVFTNVILTSVTIACILRCQFLKLI